MKLRSTLFTVILLFCFSESSAQFFLEKVATSFYTDYIVTDTAGMKMSLPHEVQKCLFSPRFVSLCDSNFLYYSDADTVFEYDITHRSKREILLVRNGPHTLCGIAWSPDSSLSMILSISPADIENNSYESMLFLITVDGSLPPRKLKAPVNYVVIKECESIPGRDFYFIDNNTVVYKKHLESLTEPGKIIQLKTNSFHY